MVPFLDLNAAHREIAAEIETALLRVLRDGPFVLGPELEAFEAAFADYCQAHWCVGVGNGQDALVLGLRALGVGPGDEVIVPAHTFVATWLAVSQVGAVPVPVEPDENNYTIDPARIEAAITAKTRAVIPVHLYGQPADLEPILELARRRGLRVLEDAAQAHGAVYKNRRIGAHGDAVAWSFYPAKNLGALGDGGAVTTDDAELAARLRMLRNYGSDEKYIHQTKGVNSRLDPLHAAVLQVKLRHLDAWNERRRQIAEIYMTGLAETGLRLPVLSDGVSSVWHLFVVATPDRDHLLATLSEQGVGAVIHYPVPPHRQAAYDELGLPPGSLPISERLADEVLSLPVGPHLAAADARMVVDAIARWSR